MPNFLRDPVTRDQGILPPLGIDHSTIIQELQETLRKTSFTETFVIEMKLRYPKVSVSTKRVQLRKMQRTAYTSLFEI